MKLNGNSSIQYESSSRHSLEALGEAGSVRKYKKPVKLRKLPPSKLISI